MPPRRFKKDTSADHQRLLHLRSSPHHVSAAALAWLIDDFRKHGLPSASSRTTQYRARNEGASRITPYGQLVYPVEIGGQELWIQNEIAMFWQSCSESDALKELVLATARRCPPTAQRPWTLIAYCDEIGFAALKYDRKKLQGLYWSIAEFGMKALVHEDAWFVVTTVRSDVAKLIAGGVSHIWMYILKHCFFNRSAHNWSEAGVIIDDIIVFLSFREGFFVADVPALKDVFKNAGASGIKFCHLCPHMVLLRTRIAATVRPRTYLQLGTNLDIENWPQHTDDSIRGLLGELNDAHDRVVAGERGAKKSYDTMCQDYGFHHCAESILLDQDLKVGAVSNCMFDWMHVYLVTGLFNHEFVWLMEFLKKHGFNYDSLHNFCRRWNWPLNTGDMQQLLSSTGCRPTDKSDHLACSASQGLSLYPVLRLWLLCLPAGICDLQVASMLALCTVLDTLCHVRFGAVSPDTLQEQIVAHLAAYLFAYSDFGWLPKHHYSMHLPAQLRKFNMLLGLWVQERRHRMAKRWGKDRSNTISYEKGIMQELTLHHLSDLRGRVSFISNGLEEPRVCKDHMLEQLRNMYGPEGDSVYYWSRVAHQDGMAFRTGDIVSYREAGSYSIGKVWFHAEIRGLCVTGLEKWEQVETQDFQCTVRVSDANSQMVPTSSLVASLIWHEASGQAVVIKSPAMLA